MHGVRADSQGYPELYPVRILESRHGSQTEPQDGEQPQNNQDCILMLAYVCVHCIHTLSISLIPVNWNTSFHFIPQSLHFTSRHACVPSASK